MSQINIDEAKALIEAAKQEELALGRQENTWYFYENHVFGAALIAKKIAEKMTGIDPERIYVSALLHDIAKTKEFDQEGIYPSTLVLDSKIKRFHGVLGYEMLKDKDDFAARASLLHMFAWNELPPFEKCSKMFFNNRKDYDFTFEYIQNHPVTDEDLLIQLADSLASKDGLMTVEQRAETYAQDHKIDVPLELFKPRVELKAYFDKKTGMNIYDLFY